MYSRLRSSQIVGFYLLSVSDILIVDFQDLPLIMNRIEQLLSQARWGTPSTFDQILKHPGKTVTWWTSA